ncbi:hypothetical protein CLBKND_01051 [Methylorubrum aminovorans]
MMRSVLNRPLVLDQAEEAGLLLCLRSDYQDTLCGPARVLGLMASEI